MMFLYAMFAFDANALFVIYGNPTLPSHSVWMLPGTWEDA
jgi:hypothetical protein